MHHAWICACQRPACCFQQRCGWGGPHFGQDFFFFFCPENRPWFPGTMQLMRVSPRKIRLWHHGFLKHAAEPTLSLAIIKPQWISTVDWNWEKEESPATVQTLFFFLLWSKCTVGSRWMLCLPFTRDLWLVITIKLDTGLLVNLSLSTLASGHDNMWA